MRETIIRFLFAAILAGLIGDYIHINLGIGVAHYDKFITTISYMTRPLEALGIGIIYYLIGDRLPVKSRLLKGILMGLLTLLTEGQLIRQLLMNLLLPNTVKEAFQFQSQVWLSHLAMTVIIAFIIKPKYSLSHANS